MDSNNNTNTSFKKVDCNRMNELSYNMTHKNRGLALIFNQKKFSAKRLETRSGTNADRNNLKRVLKNLGFEVSIHNDCKYDKLMSVVENAANRDHTDNDCILIAILTHGEEDYIYAKDREYKLETLWNFFTATNCPTLKDKPKLFVIQACQGNRLDSGLYALVDKIKKPVVSASDLVLTDFLIAYSTIPGFVSFRDMYKGSWFIQSLCNELKTNGKRSDILTLLTDVCRHVALNCETYIPEKSTLDKKKQMPYITNMLTRELIFSEGNPDNKIVKKKKNFSILCTK